MHYQGIIQKSHLPYIKNVTFTYTWLLNWGVAGWWCRAIFMSNHNSVELELCLGCVWVVAQFFLGRFHLTTTINHTYSNFSNCEHNFEIIENKSMCFLNTIDLVSHLTLTNQIIYGWYKAVTNLLVAIQVKTYGLIILHISFYFILFYSILY